MIRALRATPSPLIMTGPPEEYDFRADASESTLRIVGSMHPELVDLVQDGATEGQVTGRVMGGCLVLRSFLSSQGAWWCGKGRWTTMRGGLMATKSQNLCT